MNSDVFGLKLVVFQSLVLGTVGVSESWYRDGVVMSWLLTEVD